MILDEIFFQCYSFPACDLSAESVYIVSNIYLCEKDHNCGELDFLCFAGNIGGKVAFIVLRT